MKSLLFALFCGASFVTIAAKPELTPELLKKGEALYTANCLTCHGEKGDGMGQTGKWLKPLPRNFSKPETFKKGSKLEDIVDTILHGLKDTAMLPVALSSEEERWAVAYYVQQTFFPKGTTTKPTTSPKKSSKKSK